MDHRPASSTPADVLHYENSSMLDTIFVSKLKKKPAWITITKGSQTRLFSVSASGKLNETAIIHWQAQVQGSKKAEATVEINGEIYPADRFGRQSSGFYGKTSTRQFVIDNLDCRWSCHTPIPDTPGPGRVFQVGILLQWECTANPFDSADPTPAPSKFKSLFRPSTAKKTKLLLASYLDGIRGSQSLAIHPAGVPYTTLLLISAIFTNVEKNHWKKQQSKLSPAELEAMLSADIGGALPAYTPMRDSHSSGTALHPTVFATTPSRWRYRPPRTADASSPLPEYTAA